MTKPLSVLPKSAFVILLACFAVPAFAQHGGGGHGGGGGFHGGGGFQGGGGMRSTGGGGYRGGASRPSSAGPAAPRASAPAPLSSTGGFAARPGNNNGVRPGGNFAGGNQRFGNSVSAPLAVADGRWHSFGGGSAAGRQPFVAQPGAGPSSNASNFHVLSGNRQAESTGAIRSFSGQGGELWENSTAARNVVPRSQSLSTLHNSFRGSASASAGLRSNSTLSASSRIAGRSALLGNRQFSHSVNGAASVQQLRGFNRTGVPFDRFGRGCWNCGSGFGGWGWGGGWGFGWGWPGFGFGEWNPFWVDPWWGWPAAGYGYYAPPAYNLYSYPDATNSVPYDYSAPPAQQDEPDNSSGQDNTNGNWITPNGPSPSSIPNSASLAVPVLIYLKTGAVLSVRDYWMLDGELHYILMNGAQNSLDLEQVDLPLTNTENAKSGVKFIFKSEPGITTPVEPDAQPGNPNEPAPEAHP